MIILVRECRALRVTPLTAVTTMPPMIPIITMTTKISTSVKPLDVGRRGVIIGRDTGSFLQNVILDRSIILG